MARSGSFTKVHLAGLVLLLLSALRPTSARTPTFQRGDAEASGSINVTDAVRILRFLFLGGPETSLPCLDAADPDDDGKVEIGDAVFLLRYLFLHGRRPEYPFRSCGVDSTPDTLSCESFPACLSDLEAISLEADAVAFIIDRSPTMQDSGELLIAKREVISLFCVLREETELGVLFFAASVLKLPETGPPLRSTPDNKNLATAFIQSAQGANGTCPKPALLAALDMLSLSGGVQKAILYLSDGGATCGGADEATNMRDTLTAVAAMNTGGVTIHTVGILGLTARNEQFLRDLAGQNGGTFSRITR